MNRTAEPTRTPGPDPLDLEIERDVAELRRLSADLPSIEEPHPAYWQNFVVRVHSRIEEQSVRNRMRRLWLRWSAVSASVGAAALVVFVAFKGVIPGTEEPLRNDPPIARTAPAETRSVAGDPLFTALDKPVVMSSEDVQMYNAIVVGDDDDVFEQLVKADRAE